MKRPSYVSLSFCLVFFLWIAPPDLAAAGESAVSEPTPDRSSPKAIATSFVEWQFWQQSEHTVPFLEASTRRSKVTAEAMVSLLGGEAAETWRGRIEDIDEVLESFEQAKEKLAERSVGVVDVSTYGGLEHYEKEGGEAFPGAASEDVEQLAEVTVSVDTLRWDGQWRLEKREHTLRAVKLEDGWKIADVSLTPRSGLKIGLGSVHDLDNHVLGGSPDAPAPERSRGSAEAVTRAVAGFSQRTAQVRKLSGLGYYLSTSRRIRRAITAWAYRPRVRFFRDGRDGTLGQEAYFDYLVERSDELAEVDVEVVATSKAEGRVEVTVEVTYTDTPRYRGVRETASVEELELSEKTVQKRYVCRRDDGDGEGWVVVGGGD